jgi:hypothetical protein
MTVTEEINVLEERLRMAELGPDSDFFQEFLADEALIDGQALKAKIVEAHKPGGPTKFSEVEMTDYKIVDHGNAAVVTCTGKFTGPKWSGTMKFMRIWFKKNGRWQIIAASTVQ